MFKRSQHGFTLVELIVVIAILGILAGIAIPVYSGYIKKANQAADEQLLSAVNTAFAAACLENNAKPKEQSVDDLTVKNSALPAMPVYTESFAKYYRGNESTKFKYFETLHFDQTEGVFRGIGAGGSSEGGSGVTTLSNGWTLTVSNDGTTTTYTVTKDDGSELIYTASNADIANVTGSTFGNGTMTMGDLTGDVDTVVKATNLAINDDYLKTIIGNDILNELGLGDGATHDQLANALVIMVANKTNQSTIDEIKEKAIAGEFTFDIMEVMGDMGGTMTKVAAMYGLVTGFANSDYGKNAAIQVDTDGDGTPESMTVLEYYNQESIGLQNAESGMDGLNRVTTLMNNIMADGKMDSYLNSSQADSDLAGYLSAMNVIVGNKETLVNGNGVLDTGFADDDVLAILNGIFPSQP